MFFACLLDLLGSPAGMFLAKGREMKVGIYTRVSTHEQQTLPMQSKQLRVYARKRGWSVATEIRDVASGASARPLREELMKAARRREIDAVLVWRLDRWGRSMADLVLTLKELTDLGVGFVSLTEALDLTTPTGRAMAGMLAVFAEFERELIGERIRAGLAHARAEGRELGRPKSASLLVDDIRLLSKQGKSKSEIARQLGIGRNSVRRASLSQPV